MRVKYSGQHINSPHQIFCVPNRTHQPLFPTAYICSPTDLLYYRRRRRRRRRRRHHHHHHHHRHEG